MRWVMRKISNDNSNKYEWNYDVITKCYEIDLQMIQNNLYGTTLRFSKVWFDRFDKVQCLNLERIP